MAIPLQKKKNLRDKSYLKASTLELVTCIVEDSDMAALRALLETRRLFSLKDREPLLLTDFLMELKGRLTPGKTCDIETCKLADCAYDLTISKFSNLPDISTNKQKPDHIKLKAIDCRNYYRAFLSLMKRKKVSGTIKTHIEEETAAGSLLQRLVWKHFQLSKKECERENPFSVRYTLKTGNRNIYLWYPSRMTVREFKSWLKENTGDIDQDSPDAQGRIQDLIEKDLARGHHIPFDKSGMDQVLGTTDASSELEAKEGRIFGRRLAETVAEEKSETVDTLRPAIGELGKDGVKRLVLQIFSDISCEDYQLSRLAQQYGISKAALSRFAGSAWFERAEAENNPAIPDLWENTAQTLAASPDFMDTVVSTGFSKKLAWVLDSIEEKEGERNG